LCFRVGGLAAIISNHQAVAFGQAEKSGNY